MQQRSNAIPAESNLIKSYEAAKSAYDAGNLRREFMHALDPADMKPPKSVFFGVRTTKQQQQSFNVLKSRPLTGKGAQRPGNNSVTKLGAKIGSQGSGANILLKSHSQ